MTVDGLNIATESLFILLFFFSVSFQHALLIFEDVRVDATTLRRASVEPFHIHGVTGTFLNAPGKADYGGRYGREPYVRRFLSLTLNGCQ